MTKTVLNALAAAGLLLGACGAGIAAPSAALAQATADEKYPACAALADPVAKQQCIQREEAKTRN